MTTNDGLFFEPSVNFEKVAAEVVLPEDPNAWPNEIMQELFKQIPYIADFEPDVVMDRVDGERGFAFGHIEVSNKTEIQHGAPPDALAAAGIQHARIPIVVKDRKLQPLDILVTDDSKMLPLTETRLRQAIFRPQVFDITGRGPGDQSMIGQLYPPYRQNYGFGGGGATMSVGMGKEGSVLSAIMPTINASDHASFLSQLDGDRGLQAMYVSNGHATSSALAKLAEYVPRPVSKLGSALVSAVIPSVMQLVRASEGYTLKVATHHFWAPEVKHLSRAEAMHKLGAKVVLAADVHGSTTLATGEAPAPEEVEEQPELITDFGIYRVQDHEGKELIGYVFPNLLDLDGTSLPIFLFTNGSQKAVQGEIAGLLVSEGASLFTSHPRGEGVFYQVLNGKAQATIPMTIKTTLQMPGGEGVSLVGETYDGRQVLVKVQPNLATIAQGEDGAVLIPDTFSWMPLGNAADVELVGDPAAFQKQGHATPKVFLRYGGENSFAVSGYPVEKLGSDERQFLSLDDTLFLLAGLGVNSDYALKKVGEAAAWSRPVEVRVARELKTAAELGDEMKTSAAAFLATVPNFRQNLVKEAAVIPDPVAVDTVLSLGFINPENLGVFISYLPVIDEAQSKMCELLLAARLGLREIPTSALEKAIRSVEQTVEGLKVLAFQQS
jgi:hypothetical protein